MNTFNSFISTTASALPTGTTPQVSGGSRNQNNTQPLRVLTADAVGVRVVDNEYVNVTHAGGGCEGDADGWAHGDRLYLRGAGGGIIAANKQHVHTVNGQTHIGRMVHSVDGTRSLIIPRGWGEELDDSVLTAAPPKTRGFRKFLEAYRKSSCPSDDEDLDALCVFTAAITGIAPAKVFLRCAACSGNELISLISAYVARLGFAMPNGVIKWRGVNLRDIELIGEQPGGLPVEVTFTPIGLGGARRKGKGNRKKEATTTTVVVRPQRSKKVARGAKNSRTQSMPASVSSYLAALMSPFSQPAEGAKVPDAVSVSTNTMRVRGVINVNTDGGCRLLLRPNPVWFGCINNISRIGSGSNVVTHAGASTAFMCVSIDDISPLYSSFRVVGGGIILKNLQPAGTAVGSIQVVHLPSIDTYIGPVTLAALVPSSSDIPFKHCANITPPIAVLQFPDSEEFETSEMINSDVYIPFRHLSEAANAMRDTGKNHAYSATTTVNPGGVTTFSTGLNTTNEVPDCAKTLGWSQIYLDFDGFPAAGGNTVRIEYVLHVEGIPASNSAINGQFQSTSRDTAPPPIGWLERAWNLASSKPAMQLMESAVRHPEFRRMAAGTMTRLLTRGGITNPMRLLN